MATSTYYSTEPVEPGECCNDDNCVHCSGDAFRDHRNCTAVPPCRKYEKA